MILARITRVQESFRSRFSEWMLAAIMLGIGWMFFMPYETLALPSMSDMAFAMSEYSWALSCTLIGSARLCVLIVNGAWRRQGHARAILGLLSLLIWTQMSIVFLNSGIPSPGGVVFPVFMGAEMFLIFRAAVEAGSTDAGRRNGGR